MSEEEIGVLTHSTTLMVSIQNFLIFVVMENEEFVEEIIEEDDGKFTIKTYIMQFVHLVNFS